MKKETLVKVEQLKTDRAGDKLNHLLDLFVQQVDTTVQLFGLCDVHPALHSYLDMDLLRRQIVNEFGPDNRMLYAPGNTSEFIMDSIFDESLDEIVDAFKPCLRS